MCAARPDPLLNYRKILGCEEHCAQQPEHLTRPRHGCPFTRARLARPGTSSSSIVTVRSSRTTSPRMMARSVPTRTSGASAATR